MGIWSVATEGDSGNPFPVPHRGCREATGGELIFYGIMHFRLVRSKGIFTWHCYGLQAQSGLSRTSMNTIASHYQAFQRQKMRANVTHKHHPTLSGNEKRCLCIPKVRNKSSCACRIVSQMRKRLIMPPLIVRPHPREAKSWENVS